MTPALYLLIDRQTLLYEQVYDPQTALAEGVGTKAVFMSAKPRFKEPPGVREPNSDKIGLHKRPGPGDYRPIDKPNYSNPSAL